MTSRVAVAMGVLYAAVAVGALSVGFGSTALAADIGGTHAGFVVGGAFVFVVGFVGLRVVDIVASGVAR